MEHNFFINHFSRFLRFVTKVLVKFMDDSGFVRAGGLSFNTLLAAIPFIALVISLLNAFDVLASLESQMMQFVVNLLIPTKQEEAVTLIGTFLDNSNKLGVIGLIFFSITSIMLLNTISINLNTVWGGERPKNNFVKKFTTYTSVIIFGTLFFAASTTITSRFNFFNMEELAILNFVLLKSAPFIFDFLVILLVIGIVPSGKIWPRYLFFVSALGAVFWELLKFAFFNVSSMFIRMSVIYGAIAIIPIFLFWVYIVWIIILFALETAWVMQFKNNKNIIKNLDSTNFYERLYFYFSVFISVAEDFEKGNPAPTDEIIADRFLAHPNEVCEILLFLESVGFVIRGGSSLSAWVPARSLSKIDTVDLLSALVKKPNMTNLDFCGVSDLIDTFTKFGINNIENCSIADFLYKNRGSSI